MKTREQEYAQKVFALVTERKKKLNPEARSKYESLAHKLPVLIRSAGLVQALAFAATRTDEQRDVLVDVAWVVRNAKEGDKVEDHVAALLEQSRTADLPTYMSLTHEILHALLWFKRYAQSVLD